VDASIDIDGGIGTIKYYAGLGKGLGDTHYLVEPGMERLSREKTFQAIHILTPIKGVAIHINAFNFPSWGLWEKAAVALLSGVPVFVKPATTSCLVTYLMIKDIVDADIFPVGSISLICGGGHDLMDHVHASDAVFFTGSAETALTLRSNPQVIKSGVRFNVEADSVNMTLLGDDVEAGSTLFDAFVKEVVKEMTTKAGQKCTAIRRVVVPVSLIDQVAEAISARLSKIIVGDPSEEGVRMGPLMNKAQQKAAIEGLKILKSEAKVVFGDGTDFTPLGGNIKDGSFIQPTLLRCDKPLQAKRIHDTEVFGPVSTLMPYETIDQAWQLSTLGGGSLASSVFTDSENFAIQAIVELAPSHGRVLVVNNAVAGVHTGHGLVMPQCVHGGPGRAGGGEELGGLRGLNAYHQRSAIQCDIALLTKLDVKPVSSLTNNIK
ncbi:MAG: 3,4-dehydroadipyl-CoA semialdehyde dehydrogenase, partial [Paraglaciecola sp.]|nr:3,4-dehydroadipyl-CoA semialdehyde dehydrogenase [Paraglaciecola sp.]